jgi:hypothetical protein
VIKHTVILNIMTIYKTFTSVPYQPLTQFGKHSHLSSTLAYDKYICVLYLVICQTFLSVFYLSIFCLYQWCTYLLNRDWQIHQYILFYYCLLLRELFSYSVVWWGIVPEPTSRALYLTRQHYRKTILEGEDNNIFST